MTQFETCSFELKYESLTLNLMHKHLFKHVKTLILSGLVFNIDAELFAYFSDLRYVEIVIDNLREFFGAGNAWMRSLNANISVDLTQLRQIEEEISAGHDLVIRFDPVQRERSFNRVYTYPDEDFCLFKDFPHAHLVMPMLVFKERVVDCTCTIRFLTMYNAHYFAITDVLKPPDYEDPVDDEHAYLFDYMFVADVNSTRLG